MKTAAIICEYNPFHRGHARQFALTREALGEDTALICLMSGQFVQRGEPALFDKMVRAKAALACGADVVLENAVTNVLRSAEGYAMGSVALLNALGCVDALSFGTEQASAERLIETARLLESEAFPKTLRPFLDDGMSFAAARQRALEAIGGDGTLLCSPNSILGAEYCKALLRTASTITPLAVRRTGTYYAAELDMEAPSASAIRTAIQNAVPWLPAIPEAAHSAYHGAQLHTWQAGERAVLAVLRRMPREAFEALPHGEEGLWSRFCRAAWEENSISEICAATKSKRYAMTRIFRLLTCAYLGITREMLDAAPPYVRVLGFSERGQQILRRMKEQDEIAVLNAGTRPEDSSYFALEERASDLFSLCAKQQEPYGAERRARVILP